MFKYIIFDLDGTLINSEKGIKKSLYDSFKKSKLKLDIPKEEIIIGPPLDETIRICNSKLSYNDVEIVNNFSIPTALDLLITFDKSLNNGS